jgi:hypothetical protein
MNQWIHRRLLLYSFLIYCNLELFLCRPCRVHWYTYTNVSYHPAASIISVVSWSRDSWSKKTAILWSLSEEPQISLVSFKIHLTKTQSLSLPLLLHVKSQAVSFFSFPLKHFGEFVIAHRACYEAHLLYPPLFGYANKTNTQIKMYNFTLHTALCFSFSSLSFAHTSQCAVCLRSLLLPHWFSYIHVYIRV